MQGCRLDGGGPFGVTVRLTIDGDNLITPFHQSFQDTLAKCLLTVDYNSHQPIPLYRVHVSTWHDGALANSPQFSIAKICSDFLYQERYPSGTKTYHGSVTHWDVDSLARSIYVALSHLERQWMRSASWIRFQIGGTKRIQRGPAVVLKLTCRPILPSMI